MATSTPPTITKEHVEQMDRSKWGTYRKVVPIEAVRVEGPFAVATSEGILTCEDGYLCIDSRGYPYPVAFEEFRAIYELVEEEEE